MAVPLAPALLAPFDRFTLYNSPYPAHDHGRAVDLYPAGAIAAHPGGEARAPSPVAGEVRDTLSVEAPSRPYAAAEDHLVLVDVEAPAPAAGLVARLLHVDPVVSAGDRVAIGDDVGLLVRSGYYAPWVPGHVHLGFREPGADLRRATGSLPLELPVDVEPVAWDGTGEVVATGDTYAVLDSPDHPAPGERWAGVAADGPGERAVLDGGLDHYEGGGLLGAAGGSTAAGPVALAGQRVGVASGRDVTWDDVTVLADGDPVRGLSLFCARDALGAKLVGEGVDLAVGERVAVVVSHGTDG
jgi:hypothetical protein